MIEEAGATRASLLIRIRDPRDAEAWNRFVSIYTPVVYGFARRRGLQDADAADLAQEVLRSVSNASTRLRYDPARGGFRGWLFTVTRNKINTFFSKRKRDPLGQASLEGNSDELVAREEEADWSRDYEQRLFSCACESVKDLFQETTWQAFWRTAVEGVEPRAAALALGISPGAVYIARSRVLARIKERIAELSAD